MALTTSFIRANRVVAEVSWPQGCLPWVPQPALWQMAAISLVRFCQLAPELLAAAFLHCLQMSPQSSGGGENKEEVCCCLAMVPI